MTTAAWSRTLAGTRLTERNKALASTRGASFGRYALDPLAHLEDGHVLMLGLAEPDDPDAEEFGAEEGAVLLKRLPFRPYAHEIELMRSWPDLDYLQRTARRGEPVLRFNNVHEEKSRQMGITWTAAWILLWASMYHDTSALVLHLKLSKVADAGFTPESIFGRVRFMAESRTTDGGTSWPANLRPFDRMDFRGGTDPSIVNRLTGARVVGSGAGEDPGRGGTYTHALVDEAARISWASSVQASLISACPRGRCYNSTPFGRDNMYAELREPRRRGFVYLRHHWSQHPIYGASLHVAGEQADCALCDGVRRGDRWDANMVTTHRYPGKLTSPWYERTIVEMTDETVAQELDISYERSLEARVYPEFSAELHVLPIIELAQDVSIELSWDFGYQTTAVGIWQEYRDVLCKVGEVYAHDSAPEDVAAQVRETLRDLGVPLGHTGPSFTRQYLAVGDPAGEQHQQATARTLIDDYRAQGFNIMTQRELIPRTIIAMKRLLIGRPKPVRYSRATCPQTIRDLEQNRWPTDRQGRRKINEREPLNDKHNHMMRADAYYVTRKFPPPEEDEYPGRRNEYHWQDEEAAYRRIESYDDVPAGRSDPYRGFV